MWSWADREAVSEMVLTCSMILFVTVLFTRSTPRCSLASSVTCWWKAFILDPDILDCMKGSEARMLSTTGWLACREKPPPSVPL